MALDAQRKCSVLRFDMAKIRLWAIILWAKDSKSSRSIDLIEYIYQIRCSGHLFRDSSSAEKPFANRAVRNNSNVQFSSAHTGAHNALG